VDGRPDSVCHDRGNRDGHEGRAPVSRFPGWRSVDPATLGQPKPETPRRKRPRAESKLETDLLQQVGLAGLPMPEREVRLIPDRRFRWDFVWRSARLTVEIQGGTWVQGAHSRGAGQARDAKKQTLAVMAGWRCLVVTSDQIRSGEALGWIEEALKGARERKC
jgi:very-short-patch-repair endonuclease